MRFHLPPLLFFIFVFPLTSSLAQSIDDGFALSKDQLEKHVSSINLASDLHTQLTIDCTEKQSDNKRSLKFNCFKAKLFKGFSQYFDHLPILVSLWNQMIYSERVEFLDQLNISANTQEETNSTMSRDMVIKIVKNLYETEAAFDTFENADTRDGLLTENELSRLETNFRYAIEDQLRTDHQEMIDDFQKVTPFIKMDTEEWVNWLAPRIFSLILLNEKYPPLGYYDLLYIATQYRNMDDVYTNGHATITDVVRLFSLLDLQQPQTDEEMLKVIF